MTTTQDAPTQEAQDRGVVYAFLSLALFYPDEGVVDGLGEAQGPLHAALRRLHVPGIHLAADDLRKALATGDPADLPALHESLLGLPSGCVPYETEYDQAHIFQKAQQLADVTAFYSAFGLELSPELKERPDHVCVELEFMHVLASKEAYARAHDHGADKVALCREAQHAFLESHLGAWAPSFGRRLAEVDPRGPYGAIGRFLESFLVAEMETFTLPAAKPLDILEAEEELDPACETCPLVTGEGI